MATPESTAQTLQTIYVLYLAALDAHNMQAVESYLSPTCRQLSRQNSAWNLSSRDEIMRILSSVRDLSSPPPEKTERGKVEMRALTAEDKHTLPEIVKEESMREGWEGLRVTLEDKADDGRRVEVRYYWRFEDGKGWVQCFHDLIWVGPKISGKEGEMEVGASVFGGR